MFTIIVKGLGRQISLEWFTMVPMHAAFVFIKEALTGHAHFLGDISDC